MRLPELRIDDENGTSTLQLPRSLAKWVQPVQLSSGDVTFNQVTLGIERMSVPSLVAEASQHHDVSSGGDFTDHICDCHQA